MVVVELVVVVEVDVLVVVLVGLRDVVVEARVVVVPGAEVVVDVLVVVVVPPKSPPIEVFAGDERCPTTSENDSPMASSMTVTAPRLMPKVSAIAAANDQWRPGGRAPPRVDAGNGAAGPTEIPCSDAGRFRPEGGAETEGAADEGGA